MNTTTTNISQLILRLALGIGFILPCMDRLGLLGTPGSPGVAWGDWAHFSKYANSLMPFFSEGVSNILAAFATGCEILFGIGLILGLKTKFAAIGGALVTLTFAFFMIISNGVMAPFKYPVFVFVGSGFLLACVDHFKWSIDELLQSKSA